MVFFKEGVLIRSNSLEKNTKLTSGWGGGYLPPESMLNIYIMSSFDICD